MAQAFIGTSGWIYKHWQGVFYPAGLPQARWFAHYAGYFATVEVNYTFYRLPEEGVFDGWRAQAPPGFVYAVKASRYITHLKKLKDPEEPLARLFARVERLGPSLGPILYQLPPNWHRNRERLESFLGLLPKGRLHAFEFRHPSWFDEGIFRLLDRYGAGYCISDLPGLDSPVRATGRLAYIRLHGPGRAYEGAYSHKQLAHWAREALKFLAGGLPVYIYFNNDVAGHAVRNAMELKGMVEGCRSPASRSAAC